MTNITMPKTKEVEVKQVDVGQFGPPSDALRTAMGTIDARIKSNKVPKDEVHFFDDDGTLVGKGSTKTVWSPNPIATVTPNSYSQRDPAAKAAKENASTWNPSSTTIPPHVRRIVANGNFEVNGCLRGDASKPDTQFNIYKSDPVSLVATGYVKIGGCEEGTRSSPLEGGSDIRSKGDVFIQVHKTAHPNPGATSGSGVERTKAAVMGKIVSAGDVTINAAAHDVTALGHALVGALQIRGYGRNAPWGQVTGLGGVQITGTGTNYNSLDAKSPLLRITPTNVTVDEAAYIQATRTNSDAARDAMRTPSGMTSRIGGSR